MESSFVHHPTHGLGKIEEKILDQIGVNFFFTGKVFCKESTLTRIDETSIILNYREGRTKLEQGMGFIKQDGRLVLDPMV